MIHKRFSRTFLCPAEINPEDPLNLDKENDRTEKLCKTKVTLYPCNAFRVHATASLVFLEGKNKRKVLLNL